MCDYYINIISRKTLRVLGSRDSNHMEGICYSQTSSPSPPISRHNDNFRLALLTPTVTSRHMRSHNKLFNSNGSHAIGLWNFGHVTITWLWRNRNFSTSPVNAHRDTLSYAYSQWALTAMVLSLLDFEILVTWLSRDNDVTDMFSTSPVNAYSDKLPYA